VFRRGDTEEEAKADPSTGLARVIDNAARQGDAHGDDAAALAILQNGLARYADAPVVDRVRALLYRTELAVRSHDHALVTSSLLEARSLDLSDDERATVVDDLTHADELVSGL
jgi:hypothetical protein